MKTRFNENIVYLDSPYNKVVWLGLRQQFPLPNEYQEIPYIQTGRKDAIVIYDVFTQYSQDLGVKFKYSMPSNADICIAGGGRFTAATGSPNYAFSIFNYGGKIVNWSPSNKNGGVDWEVGATYDFDLRRDPSTHKVVLTVRKPETYVTEIVVDIKSTSDSPTDKCGPFGFFSNPLTDFTYPQYFGWPYSSIASESGNSTAVKYFMEHSKLYNGIIFYHPSTMDVFKFLYTCYNKKTHQYGLYDVFDCVFYGGFLEDVNGYWNDSRYYYEHINTASGSTRYDKEKTFLNICGPDD